MFIFQVQAKPKQKIGEVAFEYTPRRPLDVLIRSEMLTEAYLISHYGNARKLLKFKDNVRKLVAQEGARAVTYADHVIISIGTLTWEELKRKFTPKHVQEIIDRAEKITFNPAKK